MVVRAPNELLVRLKLRLRAVREPIASVALANAGQTNHQLHKALRLLSELQLDRSVFRCRAHQTREQEQESWRA